MSNHGFKLKGEVGDYDILDANNVMVGNVRRNQRHYNIARPFTVHWWDLRPTTGRKLGEFSTRSEALQYLKRYLSEDHDG